MSLWMRQIQTKKKGPKALSLITVAGHRCEVLLPLLVCRTRRWLQAAGSYAHSLSNRLEEAS